jgi:hypothetical protein
MHHGLHMYELRSSDATGGLTPSGSGHDMALAAAPTGRRCPDGSSVLEAPKASRVHEPRW